MNKESELISLKELILADECIPSLMKYIRKATLLLKSGQMDDARVEMVLNSLYCALASIEKKKDIIRSSHDELKTNLSYLKLAERCSAYLDSKFIELFGEMEEEEHNEDE